MNNKEMKIKGLMLATIILIVSFVYAVNTQPLAEGNLVDLAIFSDLNTFDSYENFTDFINSIPTAKSYHYNPWRVSGIGPQVPIFIDDVEFSAEWSNIPLAKITNGGSVVDYSQTNVQVTGVDEPDIVKTDGTYLYIVSNNKVIIVLAVPAEDAEIISEIEIDSNHHIKNIFINGDRLVFFSEENNYPLFHVEPIELETLEDRELNASKLPDSKEILFIEPWYGSPYTVIEIFDTSDIETPSSVREIKIPGRLTGARMIGDFVYLVTNQYSYEIYKVSENQTVIPNIIVDSETQEVGLAGIIQVDNPNDNNAVTNIVSVNIKNDSSEVNTKMFLIGSGHLLYVSRDNIYITYSTNTYDYDLLRNIVYEILEPYLTEEILEEIEIVKNLSIDSYQKMTVTEWILQNFTSNIDEELLKDISIEVLKRVDMTIIHRIKISNGEIEYVAQGTIQGSAKNQFSMNEQDGYLRISTTMENWRVSNLISNVDSINNIYVLDMDLEIVGKLEGLAPTEQIYATRFLGDKCYLLTFRQVDPFFVIDLSDPSNPFVEGELKIPGFSTYLHPYDDTHVIGIGKENNKVKVSLYDVSDIENPIELSKYKIEHDRNSWNSQSSALNEHKAFLFDLEKNLLVIPAGNWSKESAYVFKISLDKGVELKGKITHESGASEPKDDDCYYYDYDYVYSIKRALYIEDVLYTISDKMVKMNDLDDLSELSSIELA